MCVCVCVSVCVCMCVLVCVCVCVRCVSDFFNSFSVFVTKTSLQAEIMRHGWAINV
jgi:hypothetical protein